MENKKAKQFLFEGLVSVGEEDIRKGCRRVNVVEIVCTHV
jgi:ribosome-associated protein YbcJ (S4-like RNA binding protein)